MLATFIPGNDDRKSNKCEDLKRFGDENDVVPRHGTYSVWRLARSEKAPSGKLAIPLKDMSLNEQSRYTSYNNINLSIIKTNANIAEGW